MSPVRVLQRLCASLPSFWSAPPAESEVEMVLKINAATAAVAALLGAAALARGAVLVNFQVQNPPPVPVGAKTCTVLLVDHTFGNSYYQPYVADYTPPTACGSAGSWAGVALNLTVSANGTQYDRLGIISMHGVEIWRTSTPEPTKDGIVWTYAKDATRYIPLFAQPGAGALNFELNNVVNTQYTGQYATTVYATFYASSAQHPPAGKADLIVPLGNPASASAGPEASVPPTFSTNVTLPRNIVAVYAELYASGNGEEEFWYTNAADEYINDLPEGVTYGTGPFREVRLLVDGQLAGAALPYATIFTGGIVPTAWRPITAYGALDLPTYVLDLSPFVPLLADGHPHTISIDVASAEPAHATNANWYVSGSLQVRTDASPAPTTGRITAYAALPYAAATISGGVGEDGQVDIAVSATRSVRVEATYTSGSGHTTEVVWTQELQYKNTQRYTDNATTQIISQTATGTVLSLHNGVPVLSDVFSYPLAIDYVTLALDGSQWKATFDHQYDRTLLPAPFILGSTIAEHQVAEGYFTVSPTGNFGNGTSNNTFSYADPKGNTYTRTVHAALNNITLDVEAGSLAHGAGRWFFGPPDARDTMAVVRLPGGRSG